MEAWTYLLLIALSIGIQEASSAVNYGHPIFAVNIFNAFEENSKNMLISPSAIQTNLGVAFSAADSETSNELLVAFNGGNIGNPNTTMQKVGLMRRSVKSYFYVERRNGINEILANQTKKYLDTPIQCKAFASDNPENSAERMNNFIKGRTNYKIQNLIVKEDITNDINAIFLHTLEYRVDWEDQLSVANNGEFWNGTHSNKVEMFKLDPGYILTGKLIDLKALAVFVPFKEVGAGVLMLMPEERNELSYLVKKLQQVDISQLPVELKLNRITLIMPRLEVIAEESLLGPLKTINVVSAFSEDDADFTALLDSNKNSYIKNLKHKTYFKLTGQGLETAAATKLMEQNGGRFQIQRAQINQKKVTVNPTAKSLSPSVINIADKYCFILLRMFFSVSIGILWYENSPPKTPKKSKVNGESEESLSNVWPPIGDIEQLTGTIELSHPFFYAVIRQNTILFVGTIRNVNHFDNI